MQACNFNPIFVESRESEGITTTNSINMPKLYPLTSKTWLSQTAQSLSNSGVTFQAPNVSQFINGEFLLEFDFTMTLQGETFRPGHVFGEGASAQGYVTGSATSPALFNGGVDPLAINKLINSISFNIAGRQWTENQGRDKPENIDILATQMSRDKLKAYGIDPFTNAGIWARRRYLGNGQSTYQALSRLENNNADKYNVSHNGFDSALRPNGNNDMHPMALQHNRRYVQVISSQFSTNEPGISLTSKQGGDFFDEHMIYPVVTASPGNALNDQVYYSVRGGGALPTQSLGPTVTGVKYQLTHTLTFRVSEYLISPSLGCPYALKSEEVTRSYPTLGNPVTLQCDFNQAYLNYLAIALPAELNKDATNATPTSSGSQAVGYGYVSSPLNLVNAKLSFFTFDSTKKITSQEPIRTLYSYLDRQSMSDKIIHVSAGSRPQGITTNIATPTLRSLPPYILINVTTDTFKNTAAQKCTAANATSTGWDPIANNAINPYVLHPLTQIKISYGSQSDVVYGSVATIKQLYDDMIIMMKDPNVRALVEGTLRSKVCNSLFSYGDAFGQADDGSMYQENQGSIWSDPVIAWFGYDVYRSHYNKSRSGLPFLLIETSRLNFKPLSELPPSMPVLSEVNYGSSSYRSLQIDIAWDMNEDMYNLLKDSQQDTFTTNGVDVIFTPNVYLITRRIRSFEINDSTSVESDGQVEYNFLSNDSTLKNAILSFNAENLSTSTGHDQIQFVGGASFFSFAKDLFSKIKRALPLVASAVRGVQGLTHGRSGLLGDLNRASSALSSGLSSVGYGRKRLH